MTLELEPRVGAMRLGQGVVVIGGQGRIAVYAKFTPQALYALQCRGLINEYNKYVDKHAFRLGNVIKRGNKFLKRHGLDALVPLTAEDIETIKQGGNPPPGSLLTQL